MSELSFIPLIADALGEDDGPGALQHVFTKLQQLRGDESALPMVQSFDAFMATVGAFFVQASLDSLEEAFQIDLYSDLFANDGDESDHHSAARQVLQKNLSWPTILKALDPELIIPLPEIARANLIQNGTPIETLSIKRGQVISSTVPIQPGEYTLELETGLRLWERALERRDVIWSDDSNSKRFAVAASSDAGAAAHPTVEEAVLAGALDIRVFAGIEAGWIEIEWRAEADA